MAPRRVAPDALLVTCEHGGNRVPAAYRALMSELQALLPTHRGLDLGALGLARELAAAFEAPLVVSTVTRLLVDLNRSEGHATLHAAPVWRAPAPLREAILDQYYRPYRAEVLAHVGAACARGRRVVHIGSHSFTPVLDGDVRRADVGLLYDPARAGEVALCQRWQAALVALDPACRVRRNYPYQGRNDGHTRTLRRLFPPAAYVGVELEVNQAVVLGPARRWAALRVALIESLRVALAGH